MNGIHSSFPNIRTDINNATITNGNVSHEGEGKGSGNVSSVAVNGISFEAQNSLITGDSYNSNVDPVQVDVDNSKLIASTLARVDNADISDLARGGTPPQKLGTSPKSRPPGGM